VTEWRRVRLDWLATEERRTVNPLSVGSEKVFLYSIPALDEVGDGQEEEPEHIGSGKLLLSGGEVLISKLNPRLTRVLHAEAHESPTLASTEFVALRCGPEVEPRYLRYWLSSEWVRQQLDANTLSVTRSQQRVRPDTLTKMWVHFPDLRSQCSIADYLDAETARIDALVEKKQRIADLLEEDLVSRLDEALSRAHRLSLRRLLLEPPQYGASESGVPHPELWPRYVRITDLEADGTLRSEDARYLQPAIASRYMLRNRDVLIARSGATVGKAFIYTDTMGPCCFAGYLIRFRFDERRMLPELAALWTRTADYWAQIRAGLVQATIENVSAERYKDLLVPVPSVEEQVALVRDAVRRRERSNGARLRLTRQVGLLEEHRQALITAAVTGEIDVPGVAA